MSDDDHAVEPHNSSITDEYCDIGKHLGISIALNFIIFIVDLIGGILTSSLVLTISWFSFTSVQLSAPGKALFDTNLSVLRQAKIFRISLKDLRILQHEK